MTKPPLTGSCFTVHRLSNATAITGRLRIDGGPKVLAVPPAIWGGQPAEAIRAFREAGVVFHCANPRITDVPLHPPLIDALQGAASANANLILTTTPTPTDR